MRVVDPASGRLLVEAAVARGFAGRSVGLLGLHGLPRGQGLLIRTHQVHTVGMLFAIDAVYLTGEGRVLKVRTLRPGRFGPLVLGARWVLEIAEGEAARLGLAPGRRVRLDG